MITVAGLAPSVDITYVVDDLRLGEIHRPTRVVHVAGGKPLNLARAAHRLGADVVLVAALGGASGALLSAALRDEGVRLVEVPSPAATRTCVSIASGSTAELTEVYPYAESSPQVWSDLTTALSTQLAEHCGWLAISGGVPNGLPEDAMGELVRLGHACGARVAVDTHGPGLVAAAGAGPDLIKINRSEAAALLDCPVGDDLPTMITRIRDQLRAAVVITDGEHGAWAGDDEITVRAELSDVRGHFPVGSGDSFFAGLLTMIDSGASLSEAMITATAAGTANALVPGPGVFDLESFTELRARIEISTVP